MKEQEQKQKNKEELNGQQRLIAIDVVFEVDRGKGIEYRKERG